MSTTTLTSGKFKFDFIKPAGQPLARDPDSAMHILLMGNFKGRSEPATAKPTRVDMDNFAQVMRSWEPACQITALGKAVNLRFASLDDFHPDKLLPRLTPLCESAPAAGTTSAIVSEGESPDALLGRLMGGPTPSPAPPKPAPGAVDIGALLRSVVGANTASPASPAEQAAQSAANLARTSSLRTVLHERNFQELEANWRGLDLLLRDFGGEEHLALSVLDCGFERLKSDVSANDDLQSSALWQALQRRTGDERFALVLGFYTWNAALPELQALARAATICGTHGATFIGAAGASLAGRHSFGEEAEFQELPPELQNAWTKVRALPQASRLVLALPRFLLRQPYGALSDPIEAFRFEELTPGAAHEDFLWGNPGILCAHLLADAFLADGWSASTSGFGEVGELPVFRFKENGESIVKPCAETWMPDSAAEKIFAQGLTPVSSVKGRDAARVNLRAVSSATPAIALC